MRRHDRSVTRRLGRPVPAADERVQSDAARVREQRGWYFYDWANSAYATTAVAVFLGPYLTNVAETAAGCGAQEDPCIRAVTRVLGVDIAAGSYYSYLLALSIVVQVVVLPLTGAVADRTEHKRELLAALAFVGSLAAMAMYFVSGGRWQLGGVLYLVANMGFGASVVVYNSFLPQIAGPDERDRVSARGWALGYLGGGLLLLANLVLFSTHDMLGLSEGDAVRISLLSAGVWWAAFTVIPLRALRNRPLAALGPAATRRSPAFAAGFVQLRATLREARRYPMTLAFLAAYLVYNDGIQTVISLAALYADKELDLPQSTQISAILLVQFVAFGGALLLGRLARVYGARRVVLVSLLLWAVVVSCAYVLQRGAAAEFFLLAAGIGLVMGGSQALSRSMYAQMIPAGREAEYFSLYEISERGTSWLGALTFGVVYQLTGSYRNALVSIVAFFLVGFVLLLRVDVRRAIADAGGRQPDLV